MPIYTFHNKKTKKTSEHLIPMAELDAFLTDNPQLEQVFTKMSISRGTEAQKPSDGFRDLLRNIKNKHKGSEVNTF